MSVDLVKIIETGDRVILFNPLTLDRLSLSKTDFAADPLSAFEVMNVQRPLPSLSYEDIKLQSLRIHVTHKCNLDCSYCLEFHNQVTALHEDMDIHTVRKTLEWFETSAPDGSIMITGGEPLLNWAVVEYILDNASEKGEKLLLTNGLLVTEERARFLARKKVDVAVSLDGFSRHNANRFDQAPEKYNRVLESLSFLQEAGCRLLINCLVTSKNLPDLLDIHDYFCNGLGVKRFGYSIPHFTPDFTNDSFDMNRFTDVMLEIWERCKVSGEYVMQIMHRFVYLVISIPKLFHCPSIGSQITVIPDGRKILCTKLDSHPGTRHITGRDIFDHLPIGMQECRNCLALGLCGGGCYWDGLMRFNKYCDKRFCDFNRRITERLLIDLDRWELEYGHGVTEFLNRKFDTNLFSNEEEKYK